MNEIKLNITNITKKQYEQTKNFKDKIQCLITKFGEDKISNDGFLSVGEFDFNTSFAFDDIFVWKEFNAVAILNLFFAELESNHKLSDISNIFPSFVKLNSLISDLKDEKDCGYILISETENKIKVEEEDVGLIFNKVEDFVEYLDTFTQTIQIYSDFLNEVEQYLNNLKFSIVSSDGIKKEYSNGGRTEQVLFKSDTNLYKISIKSDSHEFQSHANLYIKDTDGWTIIKSYNPKRDFGIDISYKEQFNSDAFKPIKKSLFEIAEKIDLVA